jgi:hypothetical protein
MTAEAKRDPLPLPEEAFDDVALVVRNADKLARVCEVLATSKAVSSLAEASESVSKEAGLSEAEARTIIGTLLALHRLRSQLELSTAEFLEGLAGAVALLARKRAQEELLKSWESGLAGIRAALDEDSALGALDKATELIYSHQNVLMKARVLTDLRPVYDKPAAKIVRMVVTHQLILDYLDGSSRKRLYVAIDAVDLKKLEEQCRRAEDKARVVSESLKDLPWPTSRIGEKNE